MALILARNFLWPLLQSHIMFLLAILTRTPTTLRCIIGATQQVASATLIHKLVEYTCNVTLQCPENLFLFPMR